MVMMLPTKPKYVDVINVTNREHKLQDPLLPNGNLVFGPYEAKPIPAVTWQRKFRTSWLFRLTNPLGQEAQQKGAIPEAEPTVEVVPVLSMADIRAKAKTLSVTIPVGTTKAQALRLIAEAEGEDQ